MTGLEKILSKIEYDSNDRCRSIVSQANEKAQSIVENAQNEAQEIIASAKKETEKKVDNISQSALSSSELAKSRIILSAKLNAIDEVLNKALEKIKALDGNEYFDIIEKLIVKNAKEGEGVLRFGENDIKRLPDGFCEKVNAKLSGKSVKLGDTANIESGFILVYGDIDINCSFDAIASSKKDELRDALNTLLFSE